MFVFAISSNLLITLGGPTIQADVSPEIVAAGRDCARWGCQNVIQVYIYFFMDTLTNSVSSPASPLEAGAVGGEGPPQTTSGSKFDEAANQADADFTQQQNTSNQLPNQPHKQQSKTKPQTNPTTKPYDRFFQCGMFPRYLVIKHHDNNKNIVTENSFTVGRGLKEVVSNKHYSKIKINRQYHSRLLLIEVDERITAERLLSARRLMNIPVKVEVHQTKNSCKGVIYNDYTDMTDDELRDELASQLVTNAYRVTKNGAKTNTVFLTFAAERPPGVIDFAGFHPVRVKPYIQNPRQCSTCLCFGHGPKFCKQTKLCHKCAQVADHDPDSCPNTILCFNCEGKHSALSKDCPHYTIEEAVIARKELTGADIVSSREFVTRTHSLIDRVPKLKAVREKLPRLMSQVVAATGPTIPAQGNRPQQRGQPVNPQPAQPRHDSNPPQQSHDTVLVSKMENMMESMMDKYIAPLSTIPKQLNDLEKSLNQELESAKQTISALQKTLEGTQEVVNFMLNIPMIRHEYEKAVIGKRIKEQMGPPSSGGTATSGSERKSRSRSRGNKNRGPKTRSNTPIRTSSRAPMEHQPSTPSHGTKRKEMSSEQSPSSSAGENKGADSSPAEDPGSGTKSAAETPVKKLNRALSISPVPKEAPHSSSVSIETSMPEVETKDPIDLSFTRGVDLSSQINPSQKKPPLPSSVSQQELVMNPGSLETESSVVRRSYHTKI